MKITTEIYLNYGTTLIKFEMAFLSSVVVLAIKKSVLLEGTFEWEETRKVYNRHFFTTEYKNHIEWVKNAWFDNTIKPPYVNLSDYDPIPF